MPWFAWIMVVSVVLTAAGNILLIGRPREPVTPAAALGTLILGGLEVWALIVLGTHYIG